MENMELIIKPVGFVENSAIENIKKPSKKNSDNRKEEFRKYIEMINENECTIRILPEFSNLLEGVENFSHLLILFWPHKLSSKERKKEKVHPRGWKDIKEQGIFATRSPTRPNPVLVTSVELIERSENILKVKGLEAFNGTPVIDIKPETGRFPDNVQVPDWIRY